MVERVAERAGSFMLYEDSLPDQPDPAWFERSSWPAAAVAPGYSGGRGKTLFIRCAGTDCVLRHYYRGGQMARIARDGFLWLGESRVRSFREWRLLARMHAAGLPVPWPFAARYVRRGLVYEADLITVQIPDVVPLSTRLTAVAVGTELFNRVGHCVGRFHAAGFDHADLNAHNLQVSSRDEIFLLDFDRGRHHEQPGSWQASNLARLERSFAKVSGEGAWRFTPGHWQALLAGHRAALAGQPSR